MSATNLTKKEIAAGIVVVLLASVTGFLVGWLVGSVIIGLGR